MSDSSTHPPTPHTRFRPASRLSCSASLIRTLQGLIPLLPHWSRTLRRPHPPLSDPPSPLSQRPGGGGATYSISCIFSFGYVQSRGALSRLWPPDASPSQPSSHRTIRTMSRLPLTRSMPFPLQDSVRLPRALTSARRSLGKYPSPATLSTPLFPHPTHSLPKTPDAICPFPTFESKIALNCCPLGRAP
jgi:hypothetical protein